MHWYQYLSLTCLAIALIVYIRQFYRLVKLGSPKDVSQKTGNVNKAQVYSYTIAMMPNHKESAYLHIPSFASGMVFHVGTFLGILFFFIFFFINPIAFPMGLRLVLAGIFLITAICGFALFLKRMFVRKMRTLSHYDDYISNALTTFFQVFTGLFLIMGDLFSPCYYVMVSLLLLYMPIGKLRHLLYFFAARYHLGFFYGWRNTWPPQKL